MAKRDQTGKKNPMYGRSAILENNLKWYNDGTTEKMFEENKQPKHYKKGRLFMPVYDKRGDNNPRAKKAIVNGKIYNCLKDALKDYPHVSYSLLRNLAQNKKISKKFNLKVEYANV
jgi:hypothetical protein